MSLRLAVTADLHLGHRTGAAAVALLASYLHAEPPDVLVLAGDLGAGAQFDDCLALFADLPGRKAVTPGNHDLWVPENADYDSLDRYEKQLPGHHVQVDVTFIAPITAVSAKAGPGQAVPVADAAGATRRKYCQYTAIDDCTRLRVLRIYDRLNQNTAIQFAGYVISRLPFQVQTIQADNGAEFQSAFRWHIQDLGIGHRCIKPATPRLNGKVERSHRIDAEEFYRLPDGVVIDDTKLFNDKLAEWENSCNYHRPHGGPGGQTPCQRLKQKTQTPVKRSTSAAHLRPLQPETAGQPHSADQDGGSPRSRHATRVPLTCH